MALGRERMVAHDIAHMSSSLAVTATTVLLGGSFG